MQRRRRREDLADHDHLGSAAAVVRLRAARWRRARRTGGRRAERARRRRRARAKFRFNASAAADIASWARRATLVDFERQKRQSVRLKHTLVVELPAQLSARASELPGCRCPSCERASACPAQAAGEAEAASAISARRPVRDTGARPTRSRDSIGERASERRELDLID